jgi:hypothetical protein
MMWYYRIMIDPELIAAIMKELGYLDEDEKDDDLKSESEKSMDEPSEKSKIEKPTES